MDIEREVEAMRTRNARVEKDKAWETSFLRRAFILLVTYIGASTLLMFIGAQKPFEGAFVPCLGYLLSTVSLPPLRAHWEKWNK